MEIWFWGLEWVLALSGEGAAAAAPAAASEAASGGGDAAAAAAAAAFAAVAASAHNHEEWNNVIFRIINLEVDVCSCMFVSVPVCLLQTSTLFY